MKLIPSDEIPWDRSFGIIARLRMEDKKYAGRILKLIPEEYEIGGNLDAPVPFDCDYSVGKGTASTAQVISEMLLQSQGGVLRLFPAWDEETGDAAFFSIRAGGAFLVSAEMREGKTAYAIIRSLAGNKCRVVNPFGDDTVVRDLETDSEISFYTEGDTVCFETEAQHEYVVERRQQPLESFPVIQ